MIPALPPRCGRVFFWLLTQRSLRGIITIRNLVIHAMIGDFAMKHTSETACSLDVMRMFRSCSHLLYHRKCPPLQGKSRLLVILYRNPDAITQRDLLDQVNIRSASLSETLCKMEKEGLIIREKCESDRRNVRIMLTDAGREAARECTRRQHDDAVKLFSVLSHEERTQLLDMLTCLRDSWIETVPQEEPNKD